MVREIVAQSEWLRDDIAALTRELVRIPSPSLHEAALARRIEEAMEELGYHLVTRDSCGNVVGMLLRDESSPTLLLTSHMDTVVASQGWSRPPLEGLIEGGRLYGLGAADCKAGLVAQLYAGHILAHALFPLRGNLVVAATVAEQNGCSLGLRHLLERTLPELDLRPTFAVLGEPTALGLCYGHDGWAEVDVRVAAATNARVDEACQLIRRELDGVDSRLCKTGWPLVSIREAEPAADRQRTLRVARRLLHGETARGFARWVGQRAAFARSLGAVRVRARLHEERQELYTGKTVQVQFASEPWSSDPFAPAVDRARDALITAGIPPVLRRWELRELVMGSAGGSLVRHGIPTVGFGPGDEAQAHACDESVELDRVVQATCATAILAHAFIGRSALKVSPSWSRD